MFIQITYKTAGFRLTYVNVAHIIAVFEYEGVTHIKLNTAERADQINESVGQILEAIKDAAR